jgi:hypothetical protein
LVLSTLPEEAVLLLWVWLGKTQKSFVVFAKVGNSIVLREGTVKPHSIVRPVDIKGNLRKKLLYNLYMDVVRQAIQREDLDLQIKNHFSIHNGNTTKT